MPHITEALLIKQIFSREPAVRNLESAKNFILYFWAAESRYFYRQKVFQERTNTMQTIVLLTISNIFMTFAWYGHLKYKSSPLWLAILASWGIAFVEYCFQVPANRAGHGQFSAAQLKTMQEVITLVVFSVFSVFYLKESLKWNYLAGFALMIGAVFLIFKKW